MPEGNTEKKSDCNHAGFWDIAGQYFLSSVTGGKLIVVTTLYCKNCSQYRISMNELELPPSPVAAISKIAKPN